MCLLKAFEFCKNYIKQITGARECNINRYLISVNKRLLWITRQRYWRPQGLPSALVLMDKVFSELESFKLPCYLPIASNYHLNNLSRLSRLIREFALFHVTGCQFPRKSEKAVRLVAAWISCFIINLIRIRFIPFWKNVIKKELYKPATVELEYFHILL